MKIALPVAQYHEGNTGDYMLSAFRELGHHAEILDKSSFIDAYREHKFDLFFCIDSGEPLDFSLLPLSGPRLAMWFIDFRHNKNRPERHPNDLANESELIKHRGYIFQAQYEDYLDTQTRYQNSSWLPVAADPLVWKDLPAINKQFHIGFVGNIWDAARKHALESMIKAGVKVGFAGHGCAWKDEGAKLLRASLLGFNISSFYGEPYAYDINMRFFETLSCGIPMITNWVPSIEKLPPPPSSCVRYYRAIEEILPTVASSLKDKDFLSSGEDGRKYILEHHTYVHRAREVLQCINKL